MNKSESTLRASVRKAGGRALENPKPAPRRLRGGPQKRGGDADRYYHGLANKIPEYFVWKTMRQRCNNPDCDRYPTWGGRGIKICRRWRNFQLFLDDMGRRPTPRHTIERIDNFGPYEPDNCRWATLTEQGRNKRNNRLLTLNSETLPVSVWAERIGVNPDRIHCRLHRNWSVERALTTPLFKR